MADDSLVKVFVGSASETAGLSVELASLLDEQDHVHADHWRDLFRAGETTIEALERALGQYDFAVFVADAEDSLITRGRTASVARDNVVLEFGMFVGALGRLRTTLVVPDHFEMDLPSDLKGVTVEPWPAKRRSEPRSAMRAVAGRLARSMHAMGKLERPRTSSPTHDEAGSRSPSLIAAPNARAKPAATSDDYFTEAQRATAVLDTWKLVRTALVDAAKKNQLSASDQSLGGGALAKKLTRYGMPRGLADRTLELQRTTGSLQRNEIAVPARAEVSKFVATAREVIDAAERISEGSARRDRS